jgi:hypothetical protein
LIDLVRIGKAFRETSWEPKEDWSAASSPDSPVIVAWDVDVSMARDDAVI